VVKTNAPELLRKELSRKSWKRELVVFSGNTDCYQPLEASYGLTRACLEVCAELAQPIAMITKGALVRRDLDLLTRMQARTRASVSVTIPFADEHVARAIEPLVGTPATRFETIRRLAAAGIPTSLAIAPLIPGLNDSDIPELLERAKEAGATGAFLVLLRLSGEVKPVFEERLRAAFPLRADKILNAIRDVRGGVLNRSDFHERMVGRGPRWAMTKKLFELHCKRLGLENDHDEDSAPETPSTPRAVQRDLFEG
jgi:DNA repair photolyase